MSQALEGAPKPAATLTQQANGQRIGRSMFIGHTIGYLIAFTALHVIINGAVFMLADGPGVGFKLDFHYSGAFNLSAVPPLLHLDLLAGNLVVSSIFLAVSTLVWCDLIVRRRHDRNRSGLDGLVWIALLVIDQVLFHFGLVDTLVIRLLDLLIYAGALYLFFVLVILSGNRGENRYGDVPRPD